MAHPKWSPSHSSRGAKRTNTLPRCSRRSPTASPTTPASGRGSECSISTKPRLVAEANSIYPPRDEAFVVYDEGQSYQRRYVHYLWTAWRLGEQHPNADFLLEQPLQAMGDIADRVFSYPRIFNSPGVTDLILDLYTERGRQKRKFGRSRGGLRHLIRTLDQLDCTYDVYGMTADALRRILPADFHRWYPAAT